MRAGMLVVAMVLMSAGVASAQKTCDPAVDADCRAPKVVPAKKATKPQKTPTYTIRSLEVTGKVRGAMMLQFLERANEELERASLERRSFVPELVRTIDLEAL